MTGRIRAHRSLENPTVFGDTISNCIFTESCYLIWISASIISKICFDCELAYKNWSSKVIVTGFDSVREFGEQIIWIYEVVIYY